MPAKRLFVAMPFRDAYEPVLRVIKQAAHLLNVQSVQVGEEPFVGSIISHIRSSIESADAMVAIVSEENGNVYYEIGLAHCQQKPVLLLAEKGTKLKFDLQDHRAVFYDPTNVNACRDQVIQLMRAALEPPNEPTGFLAAAFGDRTSHGHDRVKRAVETIVSEAQLQQPVKVTEMHVRSAAELAIEVEDFMATRVRAIVDINGIVRLLKRL